MRLTGDRHKPGYYKARSQRARLDRPFLTLAGEVVNGAYSILCCSDGTSIADDHGLPTEVVFQFLLGKGTPELWGYATNYDVNYWLRDLSQAVCRVDKRGRAITPLHVLAASQHSLCYWRQFTITHYPGKLFRVTERVGKRRTTLSLWDMANFGSLSLADLAHNWHLASASDVRFLRRMALRRQCLEDGDIPEVIEYCNLRVSVLSKAVTALKAMVANLGYHPHGWYSAGSIAASAMEVNGVKVHLAHEQTPGAIHRIAEAAYYGHRFEVSRLGYLPGPLFHYDLHSAFPATMVTLPSLAGADWQHTGRRIDLDDPRRWGFAYTEWRGKPRSKLLFGPLPVRVPSGSLRYPVRSLEPGWYPLNEVRYAQCLCDLRVYDSWTLRSGSDVRPFAYLSDLYAQRISWARASDNRADVVKLILNSSYGKLAQEGKHGKVPAWQQMVYAAWITGDTRGRLLGAVRQAPHDILFLAADGLLSRVPLALSCGDNLGQWAFEEFAWAFIVASGVYFWSKPRGKTLHHSRGVGTGLLTYKAVKEAFNHSSVVRLSEQKFIGYRTATAVRFDHWLTWQTIPTAIHFTGEPRRRDGCVRDGAMLTYPKQTPEDDEADVFFKALTHEFALAGLAGELDMDVLEGEQPEGLSGADL